MSEDIEHRLAAAAERLREYELTAQRGTEVRRRMDEMSAQLDALRAAYAAEREDVERMEGMSLTSVLAALRGARDDLLARERAEAGAAHYRVREAGVRLDAVRREYEAVRARLGQLAEAPAAYAALLDEKEGWLRSSGGPRGERLLALADERGRLIAELHEIRDALAAASQAGEALTHLQHLLDEAGKFGPVRPGNALTEAIRQAQRDEAVAAAAPVAAYVDRCLAVLRTELADVDGASVTAQPATASTTRFLDVWFSQPFTDLMVWNQVGQAKHNLARSVRLVAEIYQGLEWRAGGADSRLHQLEAERRTLLTVT